MKSESHFLGSQAAKAKVIERILEIDIDGGVKVTIGDGRSKSTRQRGLQWRWNEDVAKAGIGGKHEDTKEGVHVVSKWRFGLPLIAEFYPDHYEVIMALKERFKDREDVMYFIAENYISTEIFEVPIMAKYLTSFEQYYRNKGVNLTIPDNGLLDYAESIE